jgi:hypothetical protein
MCSIDPYSANIAEGDVSHLLQCWCRQSLSGSVHDTWQALSLSTSSDLNPLVFV